MNSVRVFKNDNKTYLHLEDIKKAKLNHDFFVNCKTIRRCVDKHHIPDDCCLYMKNDKIYNQSFRTADLYLTEEYVKQNILNDDYEEKKREKLQLKKDQQEKERSETMKQRKKYDDNNLQALPDLVELEPHEKFKGENDEPLDIDVRGEKSLEGVYFKASDIGHVFQYERIDKLIIHERGDYGYNEHYKYFNTEKGWGNSPSDHPNKELYLTYLGVLKFLFCSRGNKAGRFQKWASRILFAVQMGDPEHREEVAAEALNITHKKLLQCLKMSAGAISCVYLVKIGTVGNMKQHFNLQGFSNDEDVVYKFGKSCDLGRRMREHFKSFGKDEVELVCYAYVDEEFASDAETRLKDHFQGFDLRVQDKQHTEMIVLNQQRLHTVKQIYNDLYYQYSGKSKQIIQQIKSLEEKHKYELQLKDNAIAIRDVTIAMREETIKAKDAALKEKEWELKYLRKMEELRNKGIEC